MASISFLEMAQGMKALGIFGIVFMFSCAQAAAQECKPGEHAAYRTTNGMLIELLAVGEATEAWAGGDDKFPGQAARILEVGEKGPLVIAGPMNSFMFLVDDSKMEIHWEASYTAVPHHMTLRSDDGERIVNHLAFERCALSADLTHDRRHTPKKAKK